MTQKSFTITSKQAGRADTALAKLLSGYSRSNLKQLINEGMVQVRRKGNKVELKPSTQLNTGDRVTVNIPSLAPAKRPAILYEDKNILVIDKPAGLLSQPKNLSLPREHSLMSLFADKISEHTPRGGLVHRLDRSTSGVVVLARTVAAHAHFKQQFKDREVSKFYLAICHGNMQIVPKTIDLPLRRHPKKPIARQVHPEGQSASTKLHRVLSDELFRAVDVRPTSGRSHQIRVHLAQLGNPIVGDGLYGSSTQLDDNRIFLHSYKITVHLVSGKIQSFISPLPGDMEQFIKQHNMTSVLQWLK